MQWKPLFKIPVYAPDCSWGNVCRIDEVRTTKWVRDSLSKGVVNCCGGSCCSCDKKTATVVVDMMGGDAVHEMTVDVDKTSEDAAADDI